MTGDRYRTFGEQWAAATGEVPPGTKYDPTDGGRLIPDSVRDQFPQSGHELTGESRVPRRVRAFQAVCVVFMALGALNSVAAAASGDFFDWLSQVTLAAFFGFLLWASEGIGSE